MIDLVLLILVYCFLGFGAYVVLWACKKSKVSILGWLVLGYFVLKYTYLAGYLP